MKLLQTITELNNSQKDCPFTIDRGELIFDPDSPRMLLLLKLSCDKNIRTAYFDICCYNRDGYALAILEKIPCEQCKIQAELPSLLTDSVSVILREAEFDGGEKWTSDDVFRKKIDANTTEVSFDDTARFDSSSIAKEQSPVNTVLTRKEKKALRIGKHAEEEELRQLIKNDPTERKKRIIGRIVALLVIAALLVGGWFGFQYKTEADRIYKKAANLYNSGKFEESIPELEAAKKFLIPRDEMNELYWMLGMSYSRQRDFYNAAIYFSQLGDYKESRANYRSIAEAYSGIISAGNSHTLGLNSDGTVSAVGDNSDGQCNVTNWNNIKEVSAGGNHSVALNAENKVVAVGNNEDGQCDIKGWGNITDISAGASHTVGVKNVGNVVAVGNNEYGQCEVDDWSGIVSASAGNRHTVGLKIDGTVVAVGSNEFGECNVGEWNDVVLISAGDGFTAALTYNGEILVTGDDSSGAALAEKLKDSLFISTGAYTVLSVSTSGQVFAKGSNDSNQCSTAIWQNIVSADGGARHSVAIDSNGMAYGVGDNKNGQISLDDWTNIGIPKNTVAIRKGTE